MIHSCLFVSLLEWTHLLLSGPHVPLVLADLKAPVQCSPCKEEKSDTTPCLSSPSSSQARVNSVLHRYELYQPAEPDGCGLPIRINHNIAITSDICTNVTIMFFCWFLASYSMFEVNHIHPVPYATLSIKCFVNTLGPASDSSASLYTKSRTHVISNWKWTAVSLNPLSLFSLTTQREPRRITVPPIRVIATCEAVRYYYYWHDCA